MKKKGTKEKQTRIIELEKKLEKYKKKLAVRRKGYGEVTRTRFGDSFEDQLRDDTNILTAFIESIEVELEGLRKQKMNYKESKQILEEIKKAKKILLNCHRSPDPDSIGSALAMYSVLKVLDKQVDIVCPTKNIDTSVSYLKNFRKIKSVDFSNLLFDKYDLFITLDSSSWDMVTDNKQVPFPNIPIITIDHHKTNDNYGKINLVDKDTTSVGEIVYWVFKDWKVKINQDVASAIMVAIIGDTGAFRYPGVDSRTFRTASELMSLGADKDKTIHHIYRSEDFNMLKFRGEALSRLKIDKKHKFVWIAVPYKIYKKYQDLVGVREMSASSYAQIVKGTEFGFVAIEEKPGRLSISFRSRSGFDTSKIAQSLGGGGHIYASGAKVEAPFDEAVEKVLKTARKFARENK